MFQPARCPLWAALTAALLLAGCGGGETSAEGQQPGVSAVSAPKSSGAMQLEQREALLHPRVVIRTSLGAMTLRLDAEHAPLTVDNFLNYVDSKHYDQTIFHHVDAGYAAQCGGFTADLSERSGRYPIRNEARNGRKNLRGTIAMSRQPEAIDSSTCQFFVNLADNPTLDHRGQEAEAYGYCVFGEVIEGQGVLDKLSEVKVESRESFEKLPVQTVLIESIRRLR